jgi:uncharacterized damage-inducible protein DinB
MKRALVLACLTIASVFAQKPDPLEGVWQGYDGEWLHVSRQLLQLAKAIPEKTYAWRPAPGVRSTSEVLMHIALTNFWLLSLTGKPLPEELKSAKVDPETSITQKAQVIDWLKRSLDAVKTAHANVTPDELRRMVKVDNRNAPAEGIYLRILVHANEHMGQLVAYERLNGIVPPWSQPAK